MCTDGALPWEWAVVPAVTVSSTVCQCSPCISPPSIRIVGISWRAGIAAAQGEGRRRRPFGSGMVQHSGRKGTTTHHDSTRELTGDGNKLPRSHTEAPGRDARSEWHTDGGRTSGRAHGSDTSRAEQAEIPTPVIQIRPLGDGSLAICCSLNR
jgi:hypothetical protein